MTGQVLDVLVELGESVLMPLLMEPPLLLRELHLVDCHSMEHSFVGDPAGIAAAKACLPVTWAIKTA